jgi:NTE family protein
MSRHSPSFFDGFSAEEHGRVLNRLKHRWFPSGATVIAEGDKHREIYVVQSGTARVFVTDRHGADHPVNHVGPGATLGEMSFFSDQPASATVGATSDLDVLVIGEAEFEEISVAFPRLFYNVGAILSERLARVSRRSVHSALGHAFILLDHGAPALLSYALACSLAWHTHGSTLLLIVAEGPPPPELTAFMANQGARPSSGGSANISMSQGLVPIAEGSICVQFVTPASFFAPEALAEGVGDLCRSYDQVLVQLPADTPLPALPGRVLRLCGDSHKAGNSLSVGEDAGSLYTLRGWTDTSGSAFPDGNGILRVPALAPDDAQALARGILPANTPAGKALGWAARDLAGLKVGLAFGAGSARGYAHIGVLKVLEDLGLTIDYIAGSSIGAGVAALHALGYPPKDCTGFLDRVGSAAIRLVVPTRSLLSINGLRASLRQITGETRFEDLPTPLAVVTADIVTGQEIVFNRGLLWPPLLASMAVPGVYPPQQIGVHTLVDGAVVNPVPSNVVAAMGADVVIAVKLRSRGARLAQGSSTQPRSLLHTLIRSFEMMQSNIVTEAATGATIVIEPVFECSEEYGLTSFTRGRSYIELGESAALAALPRLTSAIPWLRR